MGQHVYLPMGPFRRPEAVGTVASRMASLRRELGKQIAQLRIRGGMTQDHLAERADIDPGYLARIEAGSRGPSIEVLGRIAVGLRVQVDALWVPLKPLKPTRGPEREWAKLRAVLADADARQLNVLTAVAKLVIQKPSPARRPRKKPSD